MDEDRIILPWKDLKEMYQTADSSLFRVIRSKTRERERESEEENYSIGETNEIFDNVRYRREETRR